jgi:TRAP-type C4-dicarboxylate transport system substrate-binding protein
VVDGQENPPGIVFFEKLADVQKYYSLTRHVNEPGNVLMSRAVWDKLPGDIQNAIASAAKKATAFERAESQRDNDEMLKKIEAAGMKVNPVSEEKLAELRKVAHGLYAQALADLGPKGKELVDIGVTLNR